MRSLKFTMLLVAASSVVLLLLPACVLAADGQPSAGLSRASASVEQRDVTSLGFGDPTPHFTRGPAIYKRYTYAKLKYGLYTYGTTEHPRIRVRVRIYRGGTKLREFWVTGIANKDTGANGFKFQCKWKPGTKYRVTLKGFHEASGQTTTLDSELFWITKP